jgi:Uma2 family endonuclease
MAQPAFNHILTGEELLNLGDVGPCELIDGRIIPLSPTGGEHGTIEGNIAYLINSHIRPRSLGWVLTGEVGIYTRRDPDRVRAADVAFVSKNQIGTIPSGFLDIPPELVVEIVSPSDRWQDLREKIDEYFSIGVRALWIVEPKTRTVLVHTSPTAAVEYKETQSIVGV